MSKHRITRQFATAAVVACIALAQASAQTPQATSRHAVIDAELGADLLGWAVRLSGYANPGPAALPTLEALGDTELALTVCPDQPSSCRGLMAAYDTERRRIVYRDTLDMRNPTDQSFIVHELVHWLQHLGRGTAAIDESCTSVLAAEREAYAVQNQYLTRFMQWQRVGEVLRFTFCPAGYSDSAAIDSTPDTAIDTDTGSVTGAPTVHFDASTGPITATHAAPIASQPR